MYPQPIMNYDQYRMAPKHKVFVSYHHANDQQYRNRFEALFANVHDVLISNSVQIGEIDPGVSTERIRQVIRDDYLRDSTVTVVLIGSQTWQRKHVDWEIGSSIRDTQYNPRSGLVGILLPTYPYPTLNKYSPYTIPPRLYHNIENGFASIYNWTEDPRAISQWIHDAFQKRDRIIPDNSYPNYVNNRIGDRWQ